VGVSPTQPKSSQPAGSEPCGSARQRESEARGSEEAGRVIEPRNLYSRGQWDNRSGISGKADAVMQAESSSPEYVKASVQDTTGVEEQGMLTKG